MKDKSFTQVLCLSNQNEGANFGFDENGTIPNQHERNEFFMKYLCIYCEVLDDYIKKASEDCPFELIFEKIPKHMHTEPGLIKKELIRLLSEADKLPTAEESQSDGIDGIILGLALCGGALEGIKSERHKLIIPRAHDCISFFLGSKDKYSKLYHEYQGRAYWFSPAFLQQDFLPTPSHYERMKADYIEKYDEDSAEYLIETELKALEQYNVLAKVDSISEPDDELAAAVNDSIKAYGWTLKEHNTDMSLFNKIFAGNWENDEFLIVPAGKTVTNTYDDKIMGYC